MSTRVTAAARLSATCREQLREQLRLSLDPAPELDRLSSVVESGRLSLPDLQEMISVPAVSSVLGTLAPAEFGEIQSLLAGAGSPDPQTLAADLQAELAAAVTAAATAVNATARDITAKALEDSALELDYAVSTCRADTATGIEMRRGNEIVLMRVHDSGEVEFDHAGLSDGACGERQIQLERAAERRGVTLTQRNQSYHGAPRGGELIAAAGASGDPSLARATALAAAAPPGARQAAASRKITRAARASQRQRPRQRGGSS
jgi:hypothetical protein